MIQKQYEAQRETIRASSRPRRVTRGLQASLWALWALAVVSGGYLGWRADTLAGRPLNLLGMAISAITVGVIGLIALTLIEMRLEPWRFLE
jgi:amino acid transporter